jgi:DHA1 family tetracycline resistance protein-like MFS transporter
MLIAVRVISGALQANMSVGNAYVADITPPEERARRFGLLGAMMGVGFILGPVMGGLLGAIDLRLPFVAAGCLALVNLAYGYFVLPESLPLERRRPFAWRSANPVASLRGLARLHGVAPLVAVIVCAGLAQFILYTTWVLYTTFKFGWGPLENGWSLAAVGIVSVVVQGFLLGRLLRWFSPRRLAVLGLLSSTVAAAIQSIISSAADARTQGQALGAVGGLNSLTSVIAPAIGAPLLAMVSHLPAGDWRIGTPFFFCAALQATAMVLAVVHFRRQR